MRLPVINDTSSNLTIRASKLEGEMQNKIEVGSKLQKADAPDYTLEVMELKTPDGDLPHARTRVSVSRFDLGVRLYSISALEDPRLFLPATVAARHHVAH
jgi:hypothetical protein